MVGILPDVADQIIQSSGFAKGAFPFRYLGIPLNATRLTFDMYAQLISKVQHSILHWQSKLLSYAGKMELLNSVVFGLESFWSSCLLIPTGVLKSLKKLCRDFFWSFTPTSGKRVIFKSWDSICSPRVEGGFGIKEDLWSVSVSDPCSESLRAILKVRDHIVAHTGRNGAPSLVRSWQRCGRFSTSLAYEFFRNKFPKFYGVNVVWNSISAPKNCLIALMAIQNKLSTIDNIYPRGFMLINRCVLCKKSWENVGHLFFSCDFSSVVWHHVLIWIGFKRRAWTLHREVDWVRKRIRKRHWRSQWLQVASTSTIYYIWLERNHRIFLGQEKDSSSIISCIKFHVCVRLLQRAKGPQEDILDAVNV
ncbi:hypothetical protein RND81_12G095100 [Saponaria officinalis]|uniref:Reverse transcriptase zinc-binding domain-containing protein n=1 Tax=Saponaria officinalis TaxID=3572 RepID=A0AAW1H8G8_SAPOF